MANAYFINATPTDVTVRLNTGGLNDLTPMSPGEDKVESPAWKAAIQAFPAKDIFAGGQDGHVNEVNYSSEQSGKTRSYNITSTVSPTLDLYFFMFEDSIVGEDQTGSSAGIIIEKDPTVLEGTLKDNS